MTMLGEWVKDYLPLLFDVSGEVEIIVYGLVLILVVMFMPKGLIPTGANLYERVKDKVRPVTRKEDVVVNENNHPAD